MSDIGPETLESARRIVQSCEELFRPRGRVVMFSGGDDSLTAYSVIRELGASFDFVLHVRTGTGVSETLGFVKETVDRNGDILVVADAEDAYDKYVLRKGFFGRGRTAHNYAYHILKAGPYRKAISHELRHGKRNFPVLLFNGARKDESGNRKINLEKTYNRDPTTKNNVWVSLLFNWTKVDCLSYLRSRGIPRNPVSVALHRSAECMCGTMQSLEDRMLASALYPAWGRWIDDLEQAVLSNGHEAQWGEDRQMTARRLAGQMELPIMCQSCEAARAAEESEG